MALHVRNCLKLSSIIRQTSPGIRTLKTTTSEHPKPIYDQEERILNKVIEERAKDLPASLQNSYQKPVRKCILCEQGVQPNYKNVKLLAQFVSPYTGLLYGRHVTGLCKEMHDRVENQVNKAIMFGFMPSYIKEVEFLKDPKLCDPEKPHRPHHY